MNKRLIAILGTPANGGDSDIDGGSAATVYLSSQVIDGGNA